MIRLLQLLLVTALVAACGDATGPDGADFFGTYELQTVNGGELPYPVVILGNYRLEVLASTLTVRSNGTFTQSTSLREIDGASTTTDTESSSGSWERTGSAVRFRDTADDTITPGSFGGNTLTITVDGFTFVYQK